MKSRFIFAILACLVFVGLAGVMVYDGSKVKDVKKTAAKLQPDKEKTESEKKEILSTPIASEQTEKKKGPHLVIPQEKLSHLYLVKCSACHGRDGNGPVGSSIAGKSYDYNYSKLQDYKNNKVENTMMADLLTRTSTEELQQLAKEISAFKPRGQ